MKSIWQNNIYLIFLITYVSNASSQNVNITIPLNKTITQDNKELFGEFFVVNRNSSLSVNLEKINKNVTFFIFQSHSHLYNITLYNNSLVYGSYITGTNLGLYGTVLKPLDTYYVVNNNKVEVKVYISVHGYFKTDPIPGGDNLEFPINISPFMYTKYNKHYINLDAQAALQAPGPVALRLRMTFYRMYLPERVFDEDIYFDGIRNMMTKAMVLENGEEIPQTNGRAPMRRTLSAYRGTGSIFVAIASHWTNDSIYSVYVPTYSYACSPLVEGDCRLMDDMISQFFCASLLFIGLFTCYFGHRFFKTEMFLVGMFTGVIVTYIVISIMKDLDAPALLGASVLSGIFFGAIWLLFWWFYGIPVLAVFLTTLKFGFLCSAVIYYQVPAGYQMLHYDGFFWSYFITLMLFTSVALLTTTFLSNILCCAVLGAYAAVFSIDYYIGSTLKYIVVNTVRRAVVEKFNYAVVSPPFQWRDIMVTLLWVLLATSGFLFQHYHNRSRPPFPPPPRSITQRMPGTPFFGRRNRVSYGVIDDGERADRRRPTSSEPVVNERTRLL